MFKINYTVNQNIISHCKVLYIFVIILENNKNLNCTLYIYALINKQENNTFSLQIMRIDLNLCTWRKMAYI